MAPAAFDLDRKRDAFEPVEDSQQLDRQDATLAGRFDRS
jgi:hypothetical protein